MAPKKVLIDCDAGTDDAQAILIALAHPDKADVVAITTVFGNAPLEDTTRNVLRLLNLCGRSDIPVYPGCESSMNGTPSLATGYHGADGFGDIRDQYPQGSCHSQQEKAPCALARIAEMHKGELTLVSLGPLTNLAIAHKLDPNFLKNLEALFIMGGNTTGRGNVTSSAEFNFYSDPEAAHCVMKHAESPTFFIPLELCEDTSFDWGWYERFTTIKTEKAKFVKDIENKKTENCKKLALPKYLAHDQLAMTVAIDESVILKTQDVVAKVEVRGDFTRGQMVVDWRNRRKETENITLVTEVDRVKYERMVLSAVE